MSAHDGPAADDQRRDALGVLAPGFVGTELPDWLAGLLSDGLAGGWLFGHNVVDGDQLRALSGAIHDRRGQALVCADEEGGTVTRLHHRDGSPWPGAWALGVVDDVQTTRAVYRGMGAELAAAGVDLTAAPVADVNSEPTNPVIGVRSFGADADLVARHVTAAVHGLRDAGVASCAKHFPGHGSTTLDSHLDLPILDVDDDLLASRDLVPFAAAVRARVDTVMTGHLVVPGHGELPATLNPSLLRMLRDQVGFDGVICTDALDMAAVADRFGRERSAVLALAAGADLLCIGNPVFPGDDDAHADTLRLVEAIVAAVRADELPADRLREAAARVRGLGAAQAARRQDRAGAGADPVAPDPGDLDLARGAATRALRVSGRCGHVAGAEVVGLSTRGNIASGARQEVLTRVLAAGCGGTVRDLDELLGTHPHTRAATRGGLVLVSDDHSDLADPRLGGLLARADALVHTGIRDVPPDFGVPCVIRTFGGGLAGARAASEALAGAGR
ncbi:glycoside hydrolase family 3 N-terminal domain-containing protein [Serinicoccus kebangsaanensis]|uniref:glycoside hydrolase family 3 N-terminal domain-containing protein n=1 Tax=Serinicoccus kebangsaanensis TaxID=2602069 RepID=UPI00124C2150|nr:glycoside hydrolase family 3 N-terminal domain-containing protein [Serinicoccus kebangsaanensis]